MPAYVSKLDVSFDEHGRRRPHSRPRREETSWDFTWDAGTAAPEGVPAKVADAADAVGRDLLASAEVCTRFPGLHWAVRTEAGDYVLGIVNRRSSVALEDSAVAAEMTARVAEAVSDLLTGYEFVQWPMCPTHQHPMHPAVVDEAACWTCPKTNTVIGRIGEL